MAKVKICGVVSIAQTKFLSNAGADWIGLNLVLNSPRQISERDLELFSRLADPTPTVAIVADPCDGLIHVISDTGIAAIQLHGAETPDRVAEVKALSGLEVWKAIGVSEAADLEAAAEYSAADRLLIDAKPPKGATRSGGHGAPFDWTVLEGWTSPKPWILAGGLTPDNVAEAIRLTRADAVDVASGVEGALGLKDKALVEAFIAAAKAA